MADDDLATQVARSSADMVWIKRLLSSMRKDLKYLYINDGVW